MKENIKQLGSYRICCPYYGNFRVGKIRMVWNYTAVGDLACQVELRTTYTSFTLNIYNHKPPVIENQQWQENLKLASKNMSSWQ